MGTQRVRATKSTASQPIRGVKQAAPPVRRKVYARELPLLDLSEIRVILIDDNDFAVTLIKRLLGAMRVAGITACSDPELAGDAIKRAKPDVVIVDLDMPGKNGLEIIDDIRRGKAGVPKNVAILVVTAHADRDQVAKARNAGANWILVKPLSFRNLYEGLGRVVIDDRPFIESKGYVGPCRRVRTDLFPDPATDRRKHSEPSG